jgi:hypothetical protein
MKQVEITGKGEWRGKETRKIKKDSERNIN